MRVKNSGDATDEIIIDRITNKKPRHRQNINMMDFLDGVSGLKDKNHASGQ